MVTFLRRLPPLAQLLLAGLLVRFLLALVLPPGYDEAYYLFYGRNPNLSYLDHPVGVGLWSWIGNSLGGSILALRLPSLLSYTAALALLASATQRWFGPHAALWSVVVGSVSPLLLACGGLLLLPDSPLLLVLAGLMWWLSRHPCGVPVNARQAVGLGVLLGLLTLCKYHSLLVLLALLGWSLAKAERRTALARPWPWLGLLVWGVVSSPLWIWNLQHHWASFQFHGGRTLADSAYNISGPPLFLLTQLLLLFPTLGLLLWVGLAPQGRTAANPEARQMLRSLALPILITFTLLSGRMQVLSSWLVPAWWLLLPLAGDWLARRPQPWPASLTWSRAITLGLLAPLLALAAAQLRWGVLDRLLPAGVDTSNQLMPADSLREALQRNPRVWTALRQADVIASRRYELPGFLALALQQDSRAAYTSFSGDPRGFTYWLPSNGYQGARGVIFAMDDPQHPEDKIEWPQQVGPLVPLGSVQLHRGGQPSVRLQFVGFGPLVQPLPGPATP
ncbi:MAG: glycosyltransferase family 39 protein [Cyanobacteria bacterium]|nr:glycosyltransferase family 39 protein [Cyanobacteriota bacterium]